MGKSDGKNPHGRHRHRWKSNKNINLKETGWEFGIIWLRILTSGRWLRLQ